MPRANNHKTAAAEVAAALLSAALALCIRRMRRATQSHASSYLTPLPQS